MPCPMDRARELFKRLEAGGLAALERLPAEEEPESLFLDYKRSATAAGDPGLHRNDRENLSKALSGFANSEGGLLIWGVDSRREAGDSVRPSTRRRWLKPRASAR